MDNVDLHLTRLADWAMNTLGRAVLTATLWPGLLAVIGALIGASGLIGLAAVLSPVIFGAVLWNADAPLPVEPDQPDVAA